MQNGTATQLKLTPTGHRILVRRDRPAEEIGGMLIPKDAQTEKYCGVIVAIGPDVTTLKVDQRVIFAGYAGAKIPDPDDTMREIEDGFLVVMTDEEVLIVVG